MEPLKDAMKAGPSPHSAPKASWKTPWILPNFMGITGQVKPVHGPGTQVKKPASRSPPLDYIFSAPEGNPYKVYFKSKIFYEKLYPS